jgi:hypothetical protein
MRIDPEVFLGHVNLITGSGRGSGKTTLAQEVAFAVHSAGQSVALLSVGVEGLPNGSRRARASKKDARASDFGHDNDGRSDNELCLREGDVFVTSEVLLSLSPCSPEILDVVPGSSALGRLFIARAGREGRAVLVGPEANEYLAWIVRRIKEEAWVATVVIDGALDRLTQVASIPDVRLFYTIRIDRSNYLRVAHAMRAFAHLTKLPQHLGGSAGTCALDGPLTSHSLESVPSGTQTLVVRDFSKIFLDETELAHAQHSYRIEVMKKLNFCGFVLYLKGVRKDQFSALLDDELRGLVISYDICDGILA